MAELLAEATEWRRQLEWPQEAVGLLEVLADGGDLVDQVLNTDDVVVAQSALNQLVVGDWDTLLVDLGETTLVDHVVDGLVVWVTVSYDISNATQQTDPAYVPPCDVRGDQLEHLQGGLVQAHEHGVVQLAQTEQTKDLADLRGHTHDTTDADHDGKLGLRLDVVHALGLGLTAGGDQSTLSITVLLDVRLGALEGLLLARLLGLHIAVSGVAWSALATLTALAAVRPLAALLASFSLRLRFLRMFSGTNL